MPVDRGADPSGPPGSDSDSDRENEEYEEYEDYGDMRVSTGPAVGAGSPGEDSYARYFGTMFAPGSQPSVQPHQACHHVIRRFQECRGGMERRRLPGGGVPRTEQEVRCPLCRLTSTPTMRIHAEGRMPPQQCPVTLEMHPFDEMRTLACGHMLHKSTVSVQISRGL